MNSLRINSNIPAMNSFRSVYNNSIETARSLQKISSGLKINRGADGPADLVISEILRGQIAGITQAISNNEVSISVAQTAEDAMHEANLLLVRAKQLAIHASNEGANSAEMLEADQVEFDNAMDSLDRIARFTNYGSRRLIDGAHESAGMAVGKGLSFIEGGIKSISSDKNGFDVRVTQSATKASVVGNEALSDEILAGGETLKIYQNGKTAEYTTNEKDTNQGVVAILNSKLKSLDMDLEVTLSENNTLVVTHKEYGSKHTFSVSSKTEGVLSQNAGEIDLISNGKDVQGYFDDMQGIGDGEYLTGRKGSLIEGLKVRYEHTGENIQDDSRMVGNVYLKQNSLRFQVGDSYGATVNFGLPSVFAESLGRNVDNISGYRNMRDINLRNFQGAQDALLLIETAQNEISGFRAELGAIQRNSLEVNNRYLRAAKENMTSSESVIRDTDMAEEITRYSKEKIKLETSISMLAQANKSPRDVLALLQ